jgi:thiamine pyrophosphate-dependent acetolactate synthase large subunit-like protein
MGPATSASGARCSFTKSETVAVRAGRECLRFAVEFVECFLSPVCPTARDTGAFSEQTSSSSNVALPVAGSGGPSQAAHAMHAAEARLLLAFGARMAPRTRMTGDVRRKPESEECRRYLHSLTCIA